MAFLLALVVIAVMVVAAIACRRRETAPSSSRGDSKVPPVKNEKINESNKISKCRPDIEALPDFDWQATPPMKLRPFKPTYNITMGISTSQDSTIFIPLHATQTKPN